MQLPAGIAAEAALTRQSAAFSMIKQNAEQAQAIANLVDQSARSAPVNNTRGSSVNISA